MAHKFEPHKKHPQFCERCGYPQSEPLMHGRRPPERVPEPGEHLPGTDPEPAKIGLFYQEHLSQRVRKHESDY